MTDKKMATPKSGQETLLTGRDVNTVIGGGGRLPLLEIQKNSTERLRIEITEYRGVTFVDLRTWYVDGSGDYKPSSKGVTIRPGQVAEVVQGLMLAARAVGAQGTN